MFIPIPPANLVELVEVRFIRLTEDLASPACRQGIVTTGEHPALPRKPLGPAKLRECAKTLNDVDA